MKFPLFQSSLKENKFLLDSECFQKKKINAFLFQSGISADKNDVTIFINKVLTWWKILNFKIFQIDKLHNDPLQAEIRYLNDSWLDFIFDFGQMALNMAGSQGDHIKQLSKHTATSIDHTFNGIVSLCWHLLAISHKYVLLEQSVTDPFKK